MLDDLENEVEAINSIYGEGSLVVEGSADKQFYVLHLPKLDVSLQLCFPENYPDEPPTVLGPHSSGAQSRKGDAAHVLDLCRAAIARLFRAGEVCLYDVIEDVNSSNASDEASETGIVVAAAATSMPGDTLGGPANSAADLGVPPWTLSDVVVELKSVFVARCAPVTSPAQARQYVQHLLDSDKKVARATHNITAHRIRAANGVAFQDCNDDGETAAGGRLLHLLQLTGVWNVMVVVTRWYGGQKLGPARFAIINAVAKDALTKGAFVHDPDASKRKKRG